MEHEPSEAVSTHRYVLGLGSNHRPEANLPAALQRLGRLATIDRVSSAWVTQPVGHDGPNYVNAAALVRTPLSAEALTLGLKRIEAALGRRRSPARTVPRIPIDLDLLVQDGRPRTLDLWELAYRAAPVAELIPRLAHPYTGEPLSLCALRLSDPDRIKVRTDLLLPLAPAQTAREIPH